MIIGDPRNEHKRDGGSAGQVLELTLKGDGIISAFYTVDLILGSGGNTFPMLVDTGSSDLWVASSSCSSCNNAPKLYDPSHSSTSSSTGQNFQYPYLSGSVSGPIYWEQLTLGSYTVLHQALCAANAVSSEALYLGFSGIIGLALAPLSSIQDLIPAGSGGGNEDGAPLLSNLYGLPSGTGPQNQYFAISLSRPGFDDRNSSTNAWPSRLGIGTQVDEVVQAVAPGNFDHAINWVNLVTTAADGYTHWKARLSAVTVYTDHGPTQVTLPPAGDGGGRPVAVLDTGGPNWMASKAFCDAVYGSWGVSMNGDGTYYVPCNQALNMTVSFDSLPPIPIHPIDMSSCPGNICQNAPNCIGTLQATNSLGTASAPADVAFGVSFLRNLYVVYSQSPPSNNSGTAAVGGDVVPKFGFVPLTNITLAMQEFHNMRVLGLTPNGSRNQPDMDAGAAKASMGVLAKIMTGLGVLIGVCVLLFGVRWYILSRRFKRRGGNASTEESVPMREWVDNLKRKGTRRFQQITEFGTPDGIEGDVATKSAFGHGTLEAPSRFTHNDNPPERPSSIRQPSGPFAGFSFLTFIGARRLGLGGGYQRTANPALSEGDGLHRDTLPTEEELRRQRFEEYQRRQKENNEGRRRGNDTSVWSDVTYIDRGDGTLVPPGTPGGRTMVGSNLNPYGFPKVDEFGAAKSPGSDDGSTLHGSPELPPKDIAMYSSTSLDQRLASSRNASRSSLPLLHPQSSMATLHNKSSSGSLAPPGATPQHSTHRSVPSLDLDRPRMIREDSTKGLTESPYPLGSGSVPSTPPAGASTSSTPQGSTDQSTSFNPYLVPLSIPAQPSHAPVHPLRERMALAMEPSLSPLTEVTSQELSSPRTDPSIRQSKDVRRSILGAIAPLTADRTGGTDGSLRDSLERQSSIGGMSMESEVLVPLPITLMERARAAESWSAPMTEPRSSVVRISDDLPPLPPSRPFNVTLSDSPRASFERLPPPAPPPKEETPRMNTTTLSQPTTPPVHIQPPRPVFQAPTAQASTPPARNRNPFDLLGFDALDNRDSRFPSLTSLGAGDSRFPPFNQPSSSSATNTPRARPVNIRSASASPSRPASDVIAEGIARPRPRVTDPTLPRPYSEAAMLVPLSVPKPLHPLTSGSSGDGRGRLASGGAAGPQLTDPRVMDDRIRDGHYHGFIPRPSHPLDTAQSSSAQNPPRIMDDPARDFLPTLEHHSRGHPTLPAAGSSIPTPPIHQRTESQDRQVPPEVPLPIPRPDVEPYFFIPEPMVPFRDQPRVMDVPLRDGIPTPEHQPREHHVQPASSSSTPAALTHRASDEQDRPAPRGKLQYEKYNALIVGSSYSFANSPPTQDSPHVMDDPLRDFMPTTERQPREHHTLPASGSTRPAPPTHRMTDTSASVGPRHRGPRPMAHGPRPSPRESISNSTSTSPSTPSTRQGTTYDSPASFSSSSPFPSTAAIGGAPRHLPGQSSSSSSGSNPSLPPGAMLPRLNQSFSSTSGSPPRGQQASSSPAVPPSTVVPSHHQQQPRPPSPSNTTSEGPDAAYGGMA